MPRKKRLLVRAGTEIRPQELIHKTNPRVQQRAVSVRPVISDSALQEVANVVELVPMLLRLRLHALRPLLQHVVRVQVAAGLLRPNNLTNTSSNHTPPS